MPPAPLSRPVRVDAHTHVWDLGVRGHPWLQGPGMAPVRRTFTLDDLAPAAHAAGIGATVLVQVLADLEETREFLAAAAANPLVAGVVGWADLTDPALADTLAELRQGPGGPLLVAIRHLVQDEEDPGWLNREDVRRGLGTVARAHLAYDLLIRPHQLPAALETVRALPELTFVLDHLGKPPITAAAPEPWAGYLRALATAPHVFAKLSGLTTEAAPGAPLPHVLRPCTALALEAFGPSRLMFGSDWPVSLLATDYATTLATTRALTAHLTEAEQDQILGTTAMHAYRLQERR